jgi:SAM-dependent methyltransferase
MVSTNLADEDIIMESLSFECMTALYDETRTVHQGSLDAALDFLVARFPPAQFGSVFEPGIGTGRIAAPLAERGYRVTGVDIAREMLLLLEERIGAMTGQQADATRLPYADASFDWAVAVHFFYFIPEWRRAVDEIVRVIRPSGPLVLMHTGMGAEVPFLNERYKALCAELGNPIKARGVESTGEVVDYLKRLGYHMEVIRDRWRWVTRLRLDMALGYLESRAYSFTTVASDDVHRGAIERLGRELEREYGDLTAEVEVLNQVYLVLATR